jgi:hypothetical protein
MPHVKVLADVIYPLKIALVPHGVSTKGDMLGNVASKFVDHDIIDQHKFLELAREKYLCTRSVPGTRDILLEKHMWEIGLEK